MKTIETKMPFCKSVSRWATLWLLAFGISLAAWPGASTAQAAAPGAVVAWGNNDSGQTTVPVAAQSEVTAVAAGYGHTVALKTDGSILAWGDNDYGQTTVPVAAHSGVTAIAAGDSHTVALKNDGSVLAWGRNVEGQTTVPAGLSGVTAIAAGGYHTAALKNDGSVLAWGYNGNGQTTVPVQAQSGVTAIAAGHYYTVALKTDGSVVAWGDNEWGQTTVPVAAQSGVTAIAAGVAHTVALKTDGSVVAWGKNFYGQVTGTPTLAAPYSATSSPVTLEGQVLSGVMAIAAGWYHTVALKNDGSVVAWGANGYDYGQTRVPAGLSGATAIAAGGFHTVALVIPTAPAITRPPVSQTVNVGQGASFSVTATGYPLYYQWRKDGVNLAEPTSATYNLSPAQTTQAGNYTVVVSNSAGSVTSAPPAVLTIKPASPGSVGAWGAGNSNTGIFQDFGQSLVPAEAQSGVTAIAGGVSHTVALKSDGSVVAWGLNDNGQTSVPVEAQSGVTAIAAGQMHTVALKRDGSVVAWGNTMPVPVAAQSGVTAIAAGEFHTVALKSDGSVVAWGENWAGQTTVPVTAQSGVAAIAAGGAHTVALKTDGTVVAWGANDFGQVTGSPRTTADPLSATANPVILGGQVLSGVTAIAAGSYHTVALKNDGSVVAWVASETPVAAQSGVMAIAAGEGHTVALKNDGSVVAWGSNSYGQTTVPAGLSGVMAITAGRYHTVVLVIPIAPTITTQPLSQTVNVWQSASLTVKATGFPLYYKWRKDGLDLAGGASATYSVPFAQTNQAGSYTVVVSNPAGSATSTPPAVLTVNATAAPGSVVPWGDNGSGQADVPAGLSGVTAIAAGWYHTVALKNDGSVVAWGARGAQLGFFGGLFPIDVGQTTVPAGLSGVTAIGAGWNHTVALKTDGSVVAWGDNEYGQATVPVEAQSGVTAIAAGGYHTVALKTYGSILAWGDNDYGQTTVPVAAQSGVMAIAAGGYHTAALKSDGSVVAWGAGTNYADWPNYGQSVVPAGLSRVTAIAAGYTHTVALKNDGSVVAWGDNGAGQTTVPVAAQSGVAAIAAGLAYTVALKNDGTVVAWGDNSSGQVAGTPTTDDPLYVTASPVTLGGQVLSGVTAIAAGLRHTVALLGTGLVMPVSLNARPSGNELILSWPTNVVGYTLQSTLTLTPPATWIDSATAPAVIGAQFTVTKAITGGTRFYRLRKP